MGNIINIMGPPRQMTGRSMTKNYTDALKKKMRPGTRITDFVPDMDALREEKMKTMHQYEKSMPGRPDDINELIEIFAFTLIPWGTNADWTKIDADIDKFLACFREYEKGNLDKYDECQIDLRGIDGCPPYLNISVLLNYLAGGCSKGYPRAKEFTKKYCRYFFPEEYKFAKRLSGDSMQELMDICNFTLEGVSEEHPIGFWSGDISKLVRIVFMLEYLFDKQVCNDVYRFLINHYKNNEVPASFIDTLNKQKQPIPADSIPDMSFFIESATEICNYLGMTKYGQTLIEDLHMYTTGKTVNDLDSCTTAAHNVIKACFPDLSEMPEADQAALYMLAYFIVNAGGDHLYNIRNAFSLHVDPKDPALDQMGLKSCLAEEDKAAEEKRVKEQHEKETALQHELDKLKNENTQLKQQIKDKNSKISRQKDQIEKLKQNSTAEEKSVPKQEPAEEKEPPKPVEPGQRDSTEDIKYLSDKNVAIIGGHDSWTARLKAIFPKWMFIDPTPGNSMPDHVIANMDLIAIHSKYVAHSTVSRYKQYAKNNGIPYIYLNTSNTDIISTDLADAMRGIENDQRK